MAVHTLPLDMDLVVYQRTTLLREFRWKPDGVSYIDFTGWHAEALFGPQGDAAIITLTDGFGITLTSTGSITIEATDAEVTQLGSSPDLFWQLDLIDTTNYRFRFLRGRVSIVIDVEPAP